MLNLTSLAVLVVNQATMNRLHNSCSLLFTFSYTRRSLSEKISFGVEYSQRDAVESFVDLALLHLKTSPPLSIFLFVNLYVDSCTTIWLPKVVVCFEHNSCAGDTALVARRAVLLRQEGKVALLRVRTPSTKIIHCMLLKTETDDLCITRVTHK